MGERCPHSPLRGTGWLQGWRLTFGGEDHGWDGALATIVEDPFEQVFVALYDVTDEDVAQPRRLGVADTGLYRKTKVRVSTLTARRSPGSTSWTPTRAGCRRRATSASSPTPPRPRTPRPTTSATCAQPALSLGSATASSRTDDATSAAPVTTRPSPTKPPRRRRRPGREDRRRAPRHRPGDGVGLAAGRRRARRGRRRDRHHRPARVRAAGGRRSRRQDPLGAQRRDEPAGLPRPHPLLRGSRRPRGRARRPDRGGRRLPGGRAHQRLRRPARRPGRRARRC